MYYRITYKHKGESTENPLYIPGDQDYCLVTAKLTLAMGKAGDLTVDIPTTNPAYDDIVCLTDEIIVYEGDDEIWRGRSTTLQTDFYRTGTLDCEGVLSYLYDTYFPPFDFSGSPKTLLQQVIDNHNSCVGKDSEKYIELGDVTVEDPNDYIARSSIDYNRSLEILQDKFVNESLGGFFRIRMEDGVKKLDYLENYAQGSVASQEIRYAENLLDIAQEVQYTDTASAILPLGAKIEDEDGMQTDEYTTIAPVNGGSVYWQDDAAVASYGWICVCVTWDDVTDPSNLLSRAKTYLAQVSNAVQYFSVNAVDLSKTTDSEEPWRIGDMIRLYSRPHNLNQYAELSEMALDLLNPDNDTYTFGSDTVSMTGSARNSARDLQTSLGELSVRMDNLSVNVINAVYGNIEHIIAETITADYIWAEVGDYIVLAVEDLTADKATIEDLDAVYAWIGELSADYVTVDMLKAEDITAGNIASVTAQILDLLGTSITEGTVNTIILTADNAIIDLAVIAEAVMGTVVADLLTATYIDTNLIHIGSEDGTLMIDDSTILICDADGNPRVQIGLDGTGDYNIALWDTDGNCMFNAGGVTEYGINDGVIRDDMVAADAAIQGSKLDIPSVITEIENDGSLVMQVSQVYLGDEGLDVYLAEIQRQIDSLDPSEYEKYGIYDIIEWFCLWDSGTDAPDTPEETRAYASVFTLGKSILGSTELSDGELYNLLDYYDGVAPGQEITFDDINELQLRLNSMGKQYAGNSTVTLTFEAKCYTSSGSSSLLHIYTYLDENEGDYGYMVSNDWTEISHTFDVEDLIDDPYIQFTSTGKTGWTFRNFKLTSDKAPLRPMWTTDRLEAGDGQYLWTVTEYLRYNDSPIWGTPICLTDGYVRSTTTTLLTEFNVQQGQIDALIERVDETEVTFVTNGDTIEIQQNGYSYFIMTEAGIQSAIGDVTQTVTEGLAEFDSKLNNFSLTVDGLVETVDENYALMVDGFTYYESQIGSLVVSNEQISADLVRVEGLIDDLEFDGLSDFQAYYILSDSAEEPPDTPRYDDRAYAQIFALGVSVLGNETNTSEWTTEKLTGAEGINLLSLYETNDDDTEFDFSSDLDVFTPLSLNAYGSYVVSGKFVTLSFEVKNNSTNTREVIIQENLDSDQSQEVFNIPFSDDWVTCIWSFTVGELTNNPYIGIYNNTNMLIRHLKLEIGDTNTEFNSGTSLRYVWMSWRKIHTDGTVTWSEPELLTDAYTNLQWSYIHEEINSIDMQVGAISDTVDGIDIRVADLYIDVNEIKGTVTALTDTVDGFDARITTVEATANGVYSTVQHITEDADSIDWVVTHFAQTDSSISLVAADLDVTNKQVSQLEIDLNSISMQVYSGVDGGAIMGISVGESTAVYGRNLLLKTKYQEVFSTTSYYFSDFAVDNASGKAVCLRFKARGSGTIRIRYYHTSTSYFTWMIYTLPLETYVTEEGTVQIEADPEAWANFEYQVSSIDAPSSSSYIQVYVSGSVSFAEVKLEFLDFSDETTAHGTSWTPAPEDDMTEFALDVRQYFANSNSIAYVAAGQIWFVGGTIGIDTNNFTLDTEGNFWANNGHMDNGYFSGTVYATDGEFRGAIYATEGYIGDWQILNGGLYSDYAQITPTTLIYGSHFIVDSLGDLIATNAEIRGTIYATAGEIGGFIIDSNGFYNSAQSLVVSLGYIRCGSFYAEIGGSVIISNAIVSGTITTTEGKYTTELNGGYLSMQYDGTEYGQFRSTYWVNNDRMRGIEMGLASDGDFISFGKKASSSATEYTAAYVINYNLSDTGISGYSHVFWGNVNIQGNSSYQSGDLNVAGSVNIDGDINVSGNIYGTVQNYISLTISANGDSVTSGGTTDIDIDISDLVGSGGGSASSAEYLETDYIYIWKNDSDEIGIGVSGQTAVANISAAEVDIGENISEAGTYIYGGEIQIGTSSVSTTTMRGSVYFSPSLYLYTTASGTTSRSFVTINNQTIMVIGDTSLTATLRGRDVRLDALGSGNYGLIVATANYGMELTTTYGDLEINVDRGGIYLTALGWSLQSIAGGVWLESDYTVFGSNQEIVLTSTGTYYQSTYYPMLEITTGYTSWDVDTFIIRGKTSATSCSMVVYGTLTSFNGLSTSSVWYSSDRSLKGDIKQLDKDEESETDLIEKIEQLQPVQFTRNDDDSGRIYYGYIADDVESVIPELVKTDDDNLKYLGYTEIIPLLHLAIKKQNATIQELTARIAELESALPKSK